MNRNREELMQALSALDDFAGLKKFNCPPIYLLGGSGCILVEYMNRATLDFDILDIGYTAEMGIYFNILGDKDFLDYELTTIAPSYRERAVKLDGFTYIEVYVLSREDIIAAKLGRYSRTDKEDIEILFSGSDPDLLRDILGQVQGRTDLSPIIKKEFLKNAQAFQREYNV